MEWRSSLVLCGVLAASIPAGAQQDPQIPDPQSPAGSMPTSAPALSEGERIARLERSCADSEQNLGELRAALDSPESDFNVASAEFQELDELLTEKREALRAAEEAGGEVETLEIELEQLEQRRELARERLDLALAERRALQEQAASLEAKLAQDRAALQRLLAPAATSQPARAASAEPPSPERPLGAANTQPAGTNSVGMASEAPNRPVAQPADPATGGDAPPASETAPATAPVQEPAEPESAELRRARDEAAAAEYVAQEAEQVAASLTDRIATQQSLIATEQKLRETARQREANARETERTLMEQVRGKMAEGAPREEIAAIWKSIDSAREAQQKAQVEARERSNRLDRLQGELAELQTEQIAALEQAENLREEAQRAQQVVAQEENPFSPQNLWRWALVRGPRIIGILIGAALLMVLVRLAEHRLVHVMVGRGKDGTRLEREARARTLMSVFHNTATLVIVIGSGLMIITEFGVNIVPLMGGVAVVGLAVAFGAQNLIRDYFTGFMVLLENQYSIGDVIKIGDNSGLVERITLRITVLRDLEGVAHFIPNGTITAVRNLTHGWSQAVIDVGVSYDSDLDQVMKVLRGVAQELRADSTFRQMILSDPEVLGVEQLADSAVVIRMLVKTRPLQQWTVKRALLYRIKKRLDESGIEIPFPQRTIHLRRDGDADGSEEKSATREPMEMHRNSNR